MSQPSKRTLFYIYWLVWWQTHYHITNSSWVDMSVLLSVFVGYLLCLLTEKELLFKWASTINIQQILRIILTCLPRNCCLSVSIILSICWIFIVLAHLNNSSWVDMSVLFWVFVGYLNIQQIRRIILTCLPRNCCFSEQAQ
jgi:hypothetical protein